MNTQEFLLWEMRSRDTIDVKRCYIDIAGDLVSGVLLSQIIYWHLPDEQGRSKLRVNHDGYDWLAKKREHWWDECRISPKQFDRGVDSLEKKGLVATRLYRFDGSPTKHVRVNWEGLFESLKALEDNDFPQRSKSNSPPDSIFPKGQNPSSTKGKLETAEKVKTITETPAENTPETTLSPLPPAGGEERERRIGFEIPEPEEIPSDTPSQEQEVKSIQSQATEVFREDKISAAEAVTTKCVDPFFHKRTPVQQYAKPSNDFGLFESQEEMTDFYNQLMNLGKDLGRSCSAGWASTILQNIRSGLPNVYLDEYRQGIPLGSCDKKEWEVRPGVPHEKFITYLTERFKQNGGSREQAIAEAYRQIKDTNKAADLWQACLRTVVRLDEDWEKQKALGVSTPYIPPELQDRSSVSLEQASVAIANLTQATDTPALPSSVPKALPENFIGEPNTYKEWKPPVELSEEEKAINILRMRALLSGKKPTLEEVSELLQDPTSKFDVAVQAKAKNFLFDNKDYLADYDEQGRVIDIYQF